MTKSWFLALLVLGPVPLSLAGQARPWDPRAGLPVGSEEERYLRVLQVAGIAPAYPWSVREFAPAEVRRVLPADTIEHPWAAYWRAARDSTRSDRWGWIEPEVQAIYNSAFPFGENDGALWAGKGVTGDLRGGIWARWGRVHARIAPDAFWAQNAAFEMAPNGRVDAAAYWDPLILDPIDLPQRYGADPYDRVDPGSSELTVDWGPIGVGLGTSSQWWGPTLKYPLLLGDNAGGWPMIWAQSAAPVDLWLAHLHWRFTWGRLDQSDYAPGQAGETRRFAAGTILVLQPRHLNGLEVGVARFAERVWPANGIQIRHLFRPLTGVVSVGTEDGNDREENQLASAFVRWTFPTVGFEVYGEVLREDYARDVRALVTEPDDLMATTLGLQRVWRIGTCRLGVLRVEAVNSEVSHSERGDRFRPGAYGNDHPWPRPLPRYQHAGASQGHTQRGQLLGSPEAYSGSGFTLGADLYHPGGRWSLDLVRALRLDWLPTMAGPTGANLADVIYTLRGEAVSFRGGREWRATLAPSIELNRNLEKGHDVLNLNLALSVRGLGR